MTAFMKLNVLLKLLGIYPSAQYIEAWQRGQWLLSSSCFCRICKTILLRTFKTIMIDLLYTAALPIAEIVFLFGAKIENLKSLL